MKQVYTIGRYFKSRFKTKVYKVPVSILGFTCPNIDGTVAKGGCSFCENHSFSPNLKSEKNRFYLHPNNESNPYLDTQLEQLRAQFNLTAKELREKNGAKKFIVYFQSFTNTYAPLSTLKVLYEEALKLDDVVGISIGTRTDSITDEILEYLKELSTDKEIWVEYGIQSTKDSTLEAINRGHDVKSMKYWIKRTKEYGLNVCGHMIFGLPNESEEDMINSTKESLELGIDSIKIHPLYVVKNTLLTNDFLTKKFTPITFDEYCSALVKALKLLPKGVSVQRVCAGIENDTLLAPSWCGLSKNEQMKRIREVLRESGLNL
jgi:radical SAM protein (TIGR01212 family)